MGCFLSKPKDVNPPPREPPRVPLIPRPQGSSTPPPQNLQIPPPHDPRGSPLVAVPSRPARNPSRTRSQDPPTPPPHDTPMQPLHNSQSLPTPPTEPVSEPDVPPPYSVLPINNRQPSTLESQTLSIQIPQTPTPVLTAPPHRLPYLTTPSTPPTVTESPQLLGSSTTPPPADLTDLHSNSASQTLDPTANPLTLIISQPQVPRNPVSDEREQRIVQALKATLHLMSTTLDKIPSPVPRVQNFVKMNLGVVDLIEISSKERELQDIYDLMQEINAQFVALIDRFSIPEELQRRIDSIARSTDEFAPAQPKSSKGRFLDQSQISRVARFLRRIKEELDSQASRATTRAPSTSASGSVPEVRVTFQQLEGGGGGGGFYPDQMSVSVKIDMQPRPRDARAPMTILPTVSRPPSPDSHEDPKRASLPRCPPISPIEISAFQKWNGESSARGPDPHIA
ncbi:uncharacterized protein ARMOST_21411 [Armillaria ostoyae]|uniref:Uncharacterized protein n=1 Tax=Armillaria ostoyae TaxID=47428 RepID=A0A284S9Z8_ARMOS|nr:uncharacterized protein ARMOST_21411 [Armillaria ostoyae]